MFYRSDLTQKWGRGPRLEGWERALRLLAPFEAHACDLLHEVSPVRLEPVRVAAAPGGPAVTLKRELP